MFMKPMTPVRFAISACLFGIPFLLIACRTEGDTVSVESTPTPIPREKPADFQLSYSWEVGSLPPPYFYNYTITIGPEAAGGNYLWRRVQR